MSLGTSPIFTTTSKGKLMQLIPQDTFLALMILLTITDAAVTYRGLKHGASEANPLLHSLMKAIGVKEALVLVKAVGVYFLWSDPVMSATEQWILLGVYTAVTIYNLWLLKKIK